MKLIQLILAILLALCAIIMFYGAITTYSPIKAISIIIMGIICIGCFAFVRILPSSFEERSIADCSSYAELRE